MRVILLAAASGSLVASAVEDPLYSPTNAAGQVEVILKGHRFTPAEIHVPAGKKIELLIKNQDATADEFDSSVATRLWASSMRRPRREPLWRNKRPTAAAKKSPGVVAGARLSTREIRCDRNQATVKLPADERPVRLSATIS